MLFEELANKINPFLLNEKYFNYSISKIHSKGMDGRSAGDLMSSGNANKVLMYDFYVLDYLNTVLSYQSASFRDLSPDLEDSVKDAVTTLYPYLRNELLESVFYSICAEARHFGTYSSPPDSYVSTTEYVELLKEYNKYVKFKGKSTFDKKELVDVWGVEPPSTSTRPPQSEKVGSQENRNISFKAANYAIKKTGLSRLDFVKLCDGIFKNVSWQSNYGGEKWGDITSGWMFLNRCDKISPSSVDRNKKDIMNNLDISNETEYDKQKRVGKSEVENEKKTSQIEPMSVAIDHVYDLQHNTNTVFNKLESYKSNGGYVWVMDALDDKANVETYHELINKCSGTVKAMAMPILYNKLGTTWEQEILNERPKTSITPEVGDSFRGMPEAGMFETLYTITYVRNKVVFKDKNRDTNNSKGSLSIKDFIKKIEDGTLKYSHKKVPYTPPKYEKPESDNSNTNVANHEEELTDLQKQLKNLIATTSSIKDYDRVPITSSNELKVGDLLIGTGKLNELTHRKNIKPNVVVTYDGPADTVNTKFINVRLNGKKSDGFNVNMFDKLVPKKKESETPSDTPFEVDDMVKCISNFEYENNLTMGKTYKIVGVEFSVGSDTTIYVRIKDDKGNVGGYAKHRFEKTEEKSSVVQDYSTWKIGDKLKTINDKYIAALKVGEIVKIVKFYKKDDEWYVDVKGRTGYTKHGYWANRFEKIEEVEKTSELRDDVKKANLDIKRGDTVKCINNHGYQNKLTIGKTYTVTKTQRTIGDDDTSPELYIYVKGDNSVDIFAYSYRFKKVGVDFTNVDLGDFIEKDRSSKFTELKVGDVFEYMGADYKILELDSPVIGEALIKNLQTSFEFSADVKFLTAQIKSNTYKLHKKKPDQALSQVDAIKKSRPKIRFKVGDTVLFKSLESGKDIYGDITKIENEEALVYFPIQDDITEANSEWLNIDELKLDDQI